MLESCNRRSLQLLEGLARLGKGKQERHVAVNALLLQRLAGANALPGRRYLRSITTFSQHSLSVKKAMALSVSMVVHGSGCAPQRFSWMRLCPTGHASCRQVASAYEWFHVAWNDTRTAQGEACKLSQPCLDVQPGRLNALLGVEIHNAQPLRHSKGE